MTPELKLLSTAVTVWISASRFFHCTVVPAATSMRSGTNACPFMRATTTLGAARVGAGPCAAGRLGAAATSVRCAGADWDAGCAGGVGVLAVGGAATTLGELATGAGIVATVAVDDGSAVVVGAPMLEGSIEPDTGSGLEKKRAT